MQSGTRLVRLGSLPEMTGSQSFKCLVHTKGVHLSVFLTDEFTVTNVNTQSQNNDRVIYSGQVLFLVFI